MVLCFSRQINLNVRKRCYRLSDGVDHQTCNNNNVSSFLPLSERGALLSGTAAMASRCHVLRCLTRPSQYHHLQHHKAAQYNLRPTDAAVKWLRPSAGIYLSTLFRYFCLNCKYDNEFVPKIVDFVW